jgi:hypothetical protein
MSGPYYGKLEYDQRTGRYYVNGVHICAWLSDMEGQGVVVHLVQRDSDEAIVGMLISITDIQENGFIGCTCSGEEDD